MSTTTCLVDKCQNCPSSTVNQCNACATGWYKRTFTGGSAAYDECWSLTKLWLAVLAGLLLSLLLCALCYYCYLMGKKARTKAPYMRKQAPQTLVTEPVQPVQTVQQPVVVQQPQTVIRQQPVISQPVIQSNPVIVSPQRSPARVVQPNRVIASNVPVYRSTSPGVVARRF